ncbi:NAD(P)-dependent dehydrogenase (short-subunit alcohol dehydrogenase family) [Marmoricola sp. OAE513]|uniref:SDR family NAD(P)-dependent oxidoreductase n=1 Tax=Marmoricola sp. OAE513 TaxID=2817894 RepID=UPI001AE0EFD0
MSRRATVPPDWYVGKTAIVTGGGSGIGAALVTALRQAGAIAVVADLEPGAEGRALDVTDAEAVQALVDDVVAEHGRLDLLFNNAGITFIGETQDITLAQWNKIIDVNIRGVVHGVAAAYPQMIKQGSGTIVNTASMGGLMAAGLITSYVTTKHAVVGLSAALRSEAAAYGVGVTVVCPAAVDTPILDQGEIGRISGRDYYLKGQGVRNPVDPAVLAGKVLEAVAAGEAMVIEPVQARMAYRLQRLAPGFTRRASVKFVDKQRKRAARKKR